MVEFKWLFKIELIGINSDRSLIETIFHQTLLTSRSNSRLLFFPRNRGLKQKQKSYNKVLM